MATLALVLPRRRALAPAKSEARRRRIPVENILLFVLSFGLYIAAAWYIVFKLDFVVGDGAARVANASYVLFSRDPHLGAIAGVWPPLPAFLDIPILMFKDLWPPLLTKAFAGCIESALFGAGTVVLLNVGLRWARVVRPMRWLLCAVWIVNPEILFYNTTGMAEPPFIFFAVASMLVFLRWYENRRSALLPLLGILCGLGCLCRIDMFPLATLIGASVVVSTVHRRTSWREVETKALLFGVPALFTVMLWVGSLAILERNPLFFLSQYSNSAVVSANNFLPGTTWGGAVTYVARHTVLLYPAVVGAIALVMLNLVLRRGRLSGLLVLTFGAAVPLLDIYLLHKGEMSASLRYQIIVIPYAFLLCIYFLRQIGRTRRVVAAMTAVGMATCLGLSNIVTGQSLGDPGVAFDESPIVAAVATGKTVHQVDGGFNSVQELSSLGPRIAAADKDHGLIAVDTSAGFWIVMGAPDPKLFVVSSDLDFEGAIAQPQVYHVEYFLVPRPVGLAALDRLSVLYPGIYDTGGGFSKQVADFGGWRLFRVIGPTGRG